MNLVINGAEAVGDDSGTVLVSTGVQAVDEAYIDAFLDPGEIAPGTYTVLEVHDTGSGMDDATKARIFDPFFTTKFTGRGLGLAAVLGIVHGHRGAIRVYSAPGKGSTFKVFLPVMRSAAHTTRPGAAAGNLLGTGTVLVVDDEDVVRGMARNALMRYGYDVITARNGQEALDVFRARRDSIRLVLLDLTMPVMDGEEALRSLKTIHPNVRVLLSSGFNEVEAVRRFVGKGLAGFIQKPYTATQLAERVKQAIAVEAAGMA